MVTERFTSPWNITVYKRKVMVTQKKVMFMKMLTSPWNITVNKRKVMVTMKKSDHGEKVMVTENRSGSWKGSPHHGTLQSIEERSWSKIERSGSWKGSPHHGTLQSIEERSWSKIERSGSWKGSPHHGT